jgi:hypothetical protein
MKSTSNKSRNFSGLNSFLDAICTSSFHVPEMLSWIWVCHQGYTKLRSTKFYAEQFAQTRHLTVSTEPDAHQ